MIERPKRSVTRFFVPLIDVLILLFCIFLLMPFVDSTGEAVTPDPGTKNKSVEDELPTDIVQLQRELAKAKTDLARLQAEKNNVADNLSVKVLQIDPKNGKLYYLQDGERIDVGDQKSALTLINVHKQRSGAKEPFFLLLYPRERSGYPEQQQADAYARWFKDVQHQFDKPYAPGP
jgi:septal ring factor EnvC (AmiA/AmiB activator)